MFFAREQSTVKKEFSELWNKLFVIYSDFQKILSEKNLAYEGMAYRLAAEKMSDAEFINTIKEKYFVFAGFYALSASEEKIIHALRDKSRAELFWDSDEYYFNNPTHEAGHFLRSNSLISGNNFNWNENNLSEAKKNIRIIGIPLQVGQAKAAGMITKNIFKENLPGIAEERTAIVLPDERMLLPVLHSLPPETQRFNITMGYPVSQSPLFSLMEALFNLHKHGKGEKDKLLFYHRDVKEILLHPFITSLDKDDTGKLFHEIEKVEYVYVPASVLVDINAPAYRKIIFRQDNSIENIFSSLTSLLELLLLNTETAESFSSLDVECIAGFYSRLTRLREIVARRMPQIESGTLWNLILEDIGALKIPFSGEPLNGLQVMGFLETRALDFENVILLNLNEGTPPSSSRHGSFIPFVLRKSFGLPVFTEQDAISSYHFYRLLQRAKNIYLLYDTEVKKLATGEKSRFILQLTHELKDKANITEELITTPVHLRDVEPIVVKKDTDVMKLLDRFFKADDKANASNSFSTSKLLCYINCPLQFYFRYVAGLKQAEDMTDEIDEKTFGTLLHESMKSLYGGIKILDEKIIAQLKEEVSKTVSGVFAAEIPQKAATLYGKNLLMKRAVEELTAKILDADIKQVPIEILFLEKNIYTPFSVSEKKNVTLYGIIDRADKINGVSRVVDYKSGRVNSLKYKDVEELFTGTEKKELFQLMFYVLLFASVSGGELPAAGIYVLREIAGGAQYLNDSSLPLAEDKVSEFKSRLSQLIAEITDSRIPFAQTEDIDRCTYCEFKDICMR
ncbi:MAG TPA: PD-(D/E)XK nuclease family protein [Bacteroidia bacterium]|nr:PD-(D/E)XK nuclease family protein [Bacteroidia bacterium]